MSDATLQLTLVGRTFCLTPLPSHRQAQCTADTTCQCRATHRLLSRRTASVELFCDHHTLAWSREHERDEPPAETAGA